ncbi:MAG: phosphate/phosphite/phosphonate ABC transporter substrate-binding protein [Bdellovibrionales bacterium]
MQAVPVSSSPIRLTSLQSRVHHPVHRALALALEHRIGERVEPVLEGDWRVVREQLFEGHIQLGTLCSPYYLAEQENEHPRLVCLAGLASESFESLGKPLYCSKLIVLDSSSFQTVESLRGARVGYNEPHSLSGHHSLRIFFQERGTPHDFFGSVFKTGGHRASLRALRAKKVDVVALDSTVEDYFLRFDPKPLEELRTLATIGPFPHPPLVGHRSLGEERLAQIRLALLSLCEDQGLTEQLRRFGFHGLLPYQPEDMQALAERLKGSSNVRLAPEHHSLVGI